jgi:xylulokinase
MGIDLGTSSCKVTMISERHETTSISSKPYGVQTPRPGWSEQDPEMWWQVVVETVGAAQAIVGMSDGDDVVVGFTGQMHSLVLLDAQKQLVRPAILWSDKRSVSQCASLRQRLPEYASISGNEPIPAFTLPQLMWVRDNEPEAFRRARHAVVPKDYVRYRATGELSTDWTDASAMGMLDGRTREWSEEILVASSISRDLLPRVNAPHESVGEVRGLFPSGINAHAVSGVGDQFAVALSAGVVEPGQLSITLGTSAAILGVSNHLVDGSFCHAPTDRWLRLDSLHSGGMSLTWFQRTFCPQLSFEDMFALAAPVEAGAGGLVFLPFLSGERSSLGSGRPAGFVGLRADHSIGHCVRAILEGITCQLRRMSAGWDADLAGADTILKLRGGGARSGLWAQIIASVFNMPTSTSRLDAAFGVAMTAGLADGWWDSYLSAPAKFDDPPAAMTCVDTSRYEEVYARYIRIADALNEMEA